MCRMLSTVDCLPSRALASQRFCLMDGMLVSRPSTWDAEMSKRLAMVRHSKSRGTGFWSWRHSVSSYTTESRDLIFRISRWYVSIMSPGSVSVLCNKTRSRLSSGPQRRFLRWHVMVKRAEWYRVMVCSSAKKLALEKRSIMCVYGRSVLPRLTYAVGDMGLPSTSLIFNASIKVSGSSVIRCCTPDHAVVFFPHDVSRGLSSRTRRSSDSCMNCDITSDENVGTRNKMPYQRLSMSMARTVSLFAKCS